MRLATALDEIEIHSDERMLSSERYHDILLFSRVISAIGDLSPVTAELIEGLFEVDFRYLQSLYMERNGQLPYEIESTCPQCQGRNRVNLAEVYSNLEFYFAKDAKSP
ncbi:phage tail assembly protein [Candidatus Fermentibacteria bacterium]|nr:phage tail assembly protein [Candidatus Fermentibacteria bacterium]